MNSDYRKPLPGTTLDFFDARAAIDAIAPGAYDTLPYTARVHAENIVRRADPGLRDAYLAQLAERRRDLDFPVVPGARGLPRHPRPDRTGRSGRPARCDRRRRAATRPG
jgi:aconitate hydratase